MLLDVAKAVLKGKFIVINAYAKEEIKFLKNTFCLKEIGKKTKSKFSINK
jgi:hypothetical protein